MDILSQQLQSASWRGIPCSVTAESIPQKGRKYAIHDYPNSGKRFAQDLGELPATFDISVVIHGDKFLDDAANFEKALLTEGPGRLVLPHLGALDVVALPYRVDYKHKSIGVIGFELKFTISNTDEVPAKALPSVEDVYHASDEAKLDMQDKFVKEYKIPTDKKGLLTVANDARRAVVDTVGLYSSKISNVNAQIQKIVLDVEADLIVLVRDPQSLVEKLIYGNIELANGLFATLSDLFGNFGDFGGTTEGSLSLPGSRDRATGQRATGVDGAPDELDNVEEKKIPAEAALALTDFGKNFLDNGTSSGTNEMPLWPDDTGNRVDRNTNRILIIEAVRINSLLLGYEAAANFDYKTSADISDATIALEQAYEAVILNGDPRGIFTNDNEFKLLLDIVKSAALDVMNQKAQQVFSVADFKVGGLVSLFALTYELYAEQFGSSTDAEEFTDALVNLNLDQNPTTITGNISVFEVL